MIKRMIPVALIALPLATGAVFADEVIENSFDYINYHGEIKEVNNYNGYKSILVSGLDEGNFDQMVFNLSDDVFMINQETGKEIKFENLKKGMRVSAVYGENTPMTMSLPPQLTPEMLVVSEREESFIKAVKVGEDLISSDNEFKLNLADNVKILNTKGEKLNLSDIYGKNIIAFHSDIMTMSIPSQIVVHQIVVLDDEDLELETVTNEKFKNLQFWNKVSYGENEIRFKSRAYESDGRIMVPIRDIAKAVGCEVEWHNSEKTAIITKDNRYMDARVGDDNYGLLKMRVNLGKMAELKNGTLHVPAEFIEEVMGLNVSVTNNNIVISEIH